MKRAGYILTTLVLFSTLALAEDKPRLSSDQFEKAMNAYQVLKGSQAELGRMGSAQGLAMVLDNTGLKQNQQPTAVWVRQQDPEWGVIIGAYKSAMTRQQDQAQKVLKDSGIDTSPLSDEASKIAKDSQP